MLLRLDPPAGLDTLECLPGVTTGLPCKAMELFNSAEHNPPELCPSHPRFDKDLAVPYQVMLHVISSEQPYEHANYVADRKFSSLENLQASYGCLLKKGP